MYLQRPIHGEKVSLHAPPFSCAGLLSLTDSKSLRLALSGTEPAPPRCRLQARMAIGKFLRVVDGHKCISHS